MLRFDGSDCDFLFHEIPGVGRKLCRIAHFVHVGNMVILDASPGGSPRHQFQGCDSRSAPHFEPPED